MPGLENLFFILCYFVLSVLDFFPAFLFCSSLSSFLRFLGHARDGDLSCLLILMLLFNVSVFFHECDEGFQGFAKLMAFLN